MARIGILGGTFNPIHNGHLKLAQTAYLQLNLDKLLIIPTGLSYLKINDNVLPSDNRAMMVKLAIKDFPYFEFSDIEIRREGNTYTYETLEELRKLYPLDDFFFVIGADTLFNIEGWKYPEKIFASCTLAVMVRDESSKTDVVTQCNYLSDKYNAKTLVLEAEKTDISSTDIRNNFINGCYENNKEILPLSVYNYILENDLY